MAIILRFKPLGAADSRLGASLLVMTLAMLAPARGAHAQPDGADAVAAHLFEDGRALAQEGRWAEACPKFEASLRHDPALGTRLNLARCHERLGQFSRAWTLYREATDLAERAGSLVRRDFARARAARLELRLAKLVISAPAKAPRGLLVTWDGRPLEAGTQGITLYADAGDHRLIASAPGGNAVVEPITLVAGETRTLAIPDLTASQSRESGLAMRSSGGLAPASAAAAPTSIRKYVTIGLGATGLSAVAIGLVFGARASMNYKDAKALCATSAGCQGVDRSRATALFQDARTDAMASTALVATAGAAALASAVLYLTAPKARARATARVVPIPHEGGGGLAIFGKF